jgi:hypothetical protein
MDELYERLDTNTVCICSDVGEHFGKIRPKMYMAVGETPGVP